MSTAKPEATAKSEATSKQMFATRDFNDAGAEKSFLAGKPVDADEATLANYAAAGLVSAEQPKADQAAA